METLVERYSPMSPVATALPPACPVIVGVVIAGDVIVGVVIVGEVARTTADDAVPVGAPTAVPAMLETVVAHEPCVLVMSPV